MRVPGDNATAICHAITAAATPLIESRNLQIPGDTGAESNRCQSGVRRHGRRSSTGEQSGGMAAALQIHRRRNDNIDTESPTRTKTDASADRFMSPSFSCLYPIENVYFALAHVDTFPSLDRAENTM